MLLDKAPLPKHIYSLDNDYGMIAPDFDLEEVDNKFLSKSIQFIENHSKTSKSQPFFLFHSAQAVHLPSFPSDEFKGKTSFGPHGDFIFQLDHIVGEIIKTVNDNGFGDNTLIIFSSDNGPVLNDGYFDDAVEMLGEHTPSGGLRGGKYSLFEAGTRVPFITYWKGKTKPEVSDEIVSQIDFLNSFSSLLGSDIKSRDGVDLSDVFFNNKGNGRNDLVIEAIKRTALRSGNWAMIPPYDGAEKNLSLIHI